MTRFSLIIGILLLATGPAAAQISVESDTTSADSSLSDNNVYVRISTNARDALLFADSVMIGRVHGDFQAIPSGTQQLRLTVRDANAWSIPPVETSLDAAAGDSLEIELSFPHHYRIESVPFGARVHIEQGEGWTYLGSTPVFHTAGSPLEDLLVIEQPGYALERVEAGREIWNRHVVMLKPSDDLDPTAAQVNWQPPKQRRVWIDYAALGTALAAGVVAVHYKFKADDLYATYEETADPALRDDIKAYDVRSGVAFGVMQGGIGLFAIRLILR